MRYQLSDSTKKLIKDQGITQQELAKRIAELKESGRVSRSISQQSISRYVNGISYPEKDTEKIILEAVSSLMGSRKFRVLRKLYREEQEKEERKKAKIQLQRSTSCSNTVIKLRDVVDNKELIKMVSSEDELEDYEGQQEAVERWRVLDFWRSAPKEIQKYWLEIIGILEDFPPFLKAIIDAIKGISKETLLQLINQNYLSYCFDMPYERFATLSDKQLLLLSRLMLGASKSEQKVFEYLDKENAVYKAIITEEFDWDSMENSSPLPENGEEEAFLAYYTKSGMLSDEFIEWAGVFVCMEKEDWLMLHNAFVFSCLQEGKRDGLTSGEKDFLETIRACQRDVARREEELEKSRVRKMGQ